MQPFPFPFTFPRHDQNYSVLTPQKKSSQYHTKQRFLMLRAVSPALTTCVCVYVCMLSAMISFVREQTKPRHARPGWTRCRRSPDSIDRGLGGSYLAAVPIVMVIFVMIMGGGLTPKRQDYSLFHKALMVNPWGCPQIRKCPKSHSHGSSHAYIL